MGDSATIREVLPLGANPQRNAVMARQLRDLRCSHAWCVRGVSESVAPAQHLTPNNCGGAGVPGNIRLRLIVAPPKPKLLDQVRQAIRMRHYSHRTEQAYVGWIRRFILFHDKRHPTQMGATEVSRFLSSLATDAQVSASTQNLSLSWYYDHRKGGRDGAIAGQD